MTAAALSRKVLQFDGGFLLLAGGAARSRNCWPLSRHWSARRNEGVAAHDRQLRGSWTRHNIRYPTPPCGHRLRTDSWHQVGLIVHLLLGGSNLLYWSSFVQLNVIPMGVITTVLHIALVIAHWLCLRRLHPS